MSQRTPSDEPIVGRFRASVGAVGLLVLAALVIGGAVLAMQNGDSDGDDGPIDIDRIGDELNISVEGSEINPINGTVTVSTENETVLTDNLEKIEDGPISYRLFNLDDGSHNLRNATVRVTVETEESGGDTSEGGEGSGDDEHGQGPETEKPEATAKLDLRAIEPDGTEILVTDDDFVLGVNRTAGIQQNDGVRVAVAEGGEGGATSLNLTATFADGNLSVPLEELDEEQAETVLSRATSQISMEALPDTEGEAVWTDEDLHHEPSPELIANDTLVLEHPFLFTEVEYEIDVGDESASRSPDEHGGLSLPAETVLLENKRNFTVASDGLDRLTVAIPFEDDDVFDLARDRAEEQGLGAFDVNADSMQFEHPLLFADQPYAVTVETEAGILSRFVEADAGTLELPSDVESDIGSVLPRETAVTVTDERGRLVFEGTADAVDSKSVTLEGETLVFNESTGFGDADRAIVNISGTPTELDSEAFDGTEGVIELASAETLPAEDDTVEVILVDGSEIEQLELVVEEVETDDSLVSLPSVGLPNILLLLGTALSVLGLAVWRVSGLPVVGQASRRTVVRIGIALVMLVVVPALVAVNILSSAGPVLFFFLGGTAGGLMPLVGVNLARDTRRGFTSGVLFGMIILVAILLGTLISILVGWVLDVELLLILGLGSVYGIPAVIIVLGTLRFTESWTSAGTTRTRSPPVTVPVEVRNSVTGDPIDGEFRLEPRSTQSGAEPATIRGGRDEIQLQEGQWSFTLTQGRTTLDSKQSTYVDSSSELLFEVSPPTIEVEATVAGTTSKIPNAEVSVEHGLNGQQSTHTNENGTCTLRLPDGIEQATVTVEHPLFEEASNQVEVPNLGRSTTYTVQLTLRKGAVAVTARLGGRPVSDVAVTLSRVEQPRGLYPDAQARTDSRGQLQFDGVPIGQYQLDVALPTDSDAFAVSGGRLEVRENRTVTQRVDIEFRYSLRAHRDRIANIRRDLDDLATSTRRDDAIQTYYASVLRAVLDEIERLPQSGHPFIEHDRDPDAVAAALLAVTEEATAMLDERLSSRQNVSLFASCSSLPDVDAEWRGDVSITDVLAHTDEDRHELRSEYNRRFEAVDDRVTSELRDLAEVSPAREVLEGVNDLAQECGRATDDLQRTTGLYVLLQLLAAVEGLFDRPELRKRLEQTAY